MEQALSVQWIDSGREPQCAPNPRFPNGIDIDLSLGAKTVCERELPYPARRCGYFLVSCKLCGLRVGITTAGRIDDPRWVKVACQLERTGGEQSQ